MPEERRPRRRCAGPAPSTTVPSAAHYVGYVEEDETPEMIMKKFEELERVMAKAAGKAPGDAAAAGAEAGAGEGQERAGPSGDPGAEALVGAAGQELTEQQLMEVFKQTSIFNVKSAMANNEALLDTVGEEDEDGWIDEEEEEEELWRAYLSDADFEGEEGAGASDEEGRPQGRARAPRGAGAPRGPGRAAQHSVVTHYNTATQALIRRRVRTGPKGGITHIRVPNPLPLSWGRTIKPYVPRHLRGKLHLITEDNPEGDENLCNNGQELPLEQRVRVVTIPDLLTAGKAFWQGHGNMQAVLIREGWERGCEDDPKGAARRLAKLPIPKLCPEGFVFIWAKKTHISDMVYQLYEWKYQYVENLTWILMAPGNTILTLPSPLFQTSHQTMFIFRREGAGRDIELRHQRNPDVVFDVPCYAPGKSHHMPEEAYVAIETLLPTGKGRFLELWADPTRLRPGWSHIVEELPAEQAS